MDNQNPVPPVSEVPNPTTPLPAEALAKEGPVIPDPTSSVILSSTGDPEKHKKFPLKLVLGIILFLLLAQD